VRWSEADGGFVAICPELGDLSAFGVSASDAVQELQIAIELVLETYDEEGKAPPGARPWHEYSGQFRLRVPRSLHAWLADEADREGVSLNTFVVARLSEARGWRSNPGATPSIAVL
jgi:predicted HicB family RNase H-like nuclease